MEQTRLISLIETILNTLIGFGVSFIGWPVAAAISGIEYTGGQHFTVVAFFTALSIARGYAIRRFFNNGLHLAAVKLAKRMVSIHE